MNFLAPQLYGSVYYYCMTVLAVTALFALSSQSKDRLLIGSKTAPTKATILAVLIILYIGTRPLSGAFGDMKTYAYDYYRTISPTSRIPVDYSGEWLFTLLMKLCGVLHFDYQGFCVVVSLLYVGLLLIACYRFSRNHSYIILLFVVSAFSFFSYGTNGVRNGLACSIVILALSFVSGTNRDRIIAAILCYAAYSIHHSAALPALAMFVSYYFIRGPKWCIAFWFMSIIISIVAGDEMETFFSGLGFDDRLSGYIGNAANEATMAQFSKTGFRWDFLLFSFMPIWLGWYVVMRRKITDRKYIVLLNTYILSNAFWVMVIRASFSNRFAYLSWFMYGLVLAYPLIKINVFRRQGFVTGLILMAQVAFNIIMMLI
ncbi:MAG: EpsG family protein [Muribaculaceae bacterium]